MGVGATAPPAPSPAAPLVVWAVSDGRAGMANQTLGLAEAIASLAPAEVVVKPIAYRAGLGRLPTPLLLFPRAALDPASAIAPPWPDIWIGAGRATLPLSLRMRRWSQGRTFVVQLQDPKTGLGAYDLVIPPRHDGLSGRNVFAVSGSPNRISPVRLATALDQFRDRLPVGPGPRIAVLIGGHSRHFKLDRGAAETIADGIDQALEATGGVLLLTFSRRTPDAARALITERLAARRGWIWDGTGENPYFAFLAAADVVCVSEESTNMATEAAAAGKPVYLLPLTGGSARMDAFHRDLIERGAARRFEGRLEPWSVEPLRETEKAAQEVLRRLELFRR